MSEEIPSFLEEVAGILFVAIVAAGVVFCLNILLQRKLLREQNKNKLIDMLLELLQEQSLAYEKYWDPRTPPKILEVADIIVPMTRFNTLLTVAADKYKLRDGGQIYDQSMEFHQIATSGNFNLTSPNKSAKKVLEIYSAYNKLTLMLWENNDTAINMHFKNHLKRRVS